MGIEGNLGLITGIVTSVLTLFCFFGLILFKVVMAKIAESKDSANNAHTRIDKTIEDFNKRRDADMKEIRSELTKISIQLATIKPGPA